MFMIKKIFGCSSVQCAVPIRRDEIFKVMLLKIFPPLVFFKGPTGSFYPTEWALDVQNLKSCVTLLMYIFVNEWYRGPEPKTPGPLRQKIAVPIPVPRLQIHRIWGARFREMWLFLCI
jgi:hypothetical protein